MSDTDLSSDSETHNIVKRNRSRSPIIKTNTSLNKSFNSETTENFININMAHAQANVAPPVQPVAAPANPFRMEYLNIVPEFIGNPNNLIEFITSSEQLINTFFNLQNIDDFNNTLLLKSIRNKIKGEAANNLAAYNIRTWLELKNALLATYADKRDHQTLMIELCSMKQYNLTPIEFFMKIQNNLNLQINFIKTHSATDDEVMYLSEFSQKTALRVLLKHLNSPLCDYLSTRNPGSMNEALYILTNDFNVANSKNSQPVKNSVKPSYQQQMPFHKPQPKFQNQYFSPKPLTSQPQMTNVFRPNKNFIHSNKPTPMSVNTRNTFTPNTGYKPPYNKPNYRSQNNWIAEELHNNEDEVECEMRTDFSDQYNNDTECNDDHFLDQGASDTET